MINLKNCTLSVSPDVPRVFIHPDGDDLTGDGSETRPFSTSRRAIEAIPDGGVFMVMPSPDWCLFKDGLRKRGP